MLINLSNHPSHLWSEKQFSEANTQFGEVIDIPFPSVDPDSDIEWTERIAGEYLELILQTAAKNSGVTVVHLMGEFSFVFRLLLLLRNSGLKAVCSTSQREVIINEDGSKTVRFDFRRFRYYY
ncbi:MAG: hypothetical protein GX452_13700 [Ignavibacteriales bacterium]|jgi:hypothetical protein|nr:hypothetical protein [Ignavibacteriaceae bacterium]NLH62448.1 hypothetical protein [Ignavibacteriales bacterium]